MRSKGTTALEGHDLIGYSDMLAKTPGGLWLAEHARGAKTALHVNNVLSALDCAAAGMGIVAAPRFLASRDPELEMLPRPATIGAGSVYLVTLRDLVKVPRIRATIDALTTHIREQVKLRG